MYIFYTQVMGSMREITKNGAKFMDGQEMKFDTIILATGYKSNVPTWLKVRTCTYVRGYFGYNRIIIYIYMCVMYVCYVCFDVIHNLTSLSILQHNSKPTKRCLFSYYYTKEKI